MTPRSLLSSDILIDSAIVEGRSYDNLVSYGGHKDRKRRTIQETLKREKAQTRGLTHMVSEEKNRGVGSHSEMVRLGE